VSHAVPGRDEQGRLRDEPSAPPVLAHRRVFKGLVWDLDEDTVDLGHAQVVRQYVAHPGAVAVIALDDDDRVLLLSQYRHPVRHVLWEPPAGLLDVEGEDEQEAAARELAEEADLVAGSWARLVGFYTSAGGSSEHITVFLARDLAPVDEAELFERRDEEADMEAVWVPLDDAVAGVLAGRLQCPTTVVGVLAAAAARSRSGDDLG
jgi:ADP-ribose pyrophosphatase